MFFAVVPFKMSLSKPQHSDDQSMLLSGETADIKMHYYKLKHFCRICNSCNAIPKPQERCDPIEAEKYSTEIFDIWNINVDDDNDKIHLPYICKACKGKITR